MKSPEDTSNFDIEETSRNHVSSFFAVFILLYELTALFRCAALFDNATADQRNAFLTVRIHTFRDYVKFSLAGKPFMRLSKSSFSYAAQWRLPPFFFSLSIFLAACQKNQWFVVRALHILGRFVWLWYLDKLLIIYFWLSGLLCKLSVSVLSVSRWCIYSMQNKFME